MLVGWSSSSYAERAKRVFLHTITKPLIQEFEKKINKDALTSNMNYGNLYRSQHPGYKIKDFQNTPYCKILFEQQNDGTFSIDMYDHNVYHAYEAKKMLCIGNEEILTNLFTFVIEIYDKNKTKFYLYVKMVYYCHLSKWNVKKK
jgi:hypothetical protein